MNYLAEIVAFNDWKELNPLPAAPIALWYELMAACNRSGWAQEFTVANAVLQARAGLSRKEFERARTLLVEAGRIVYTRSERVNQAGTYRLIPLAKKEAQKEQRRGPQAGGNSLPETGGSTGGTTGAPPGREAGLSRTAREQGPAGMVNKNQNKNKEESMLSAVPAPEPGAQGLGAELEAAYRKAVPPSKHSPSDRAVLERMAAEHGEEIVRQAVQTLAGRTASGWCPASPMAYLAGMISRAYKGVPLVTGSSLPDGGEFNEVEVYR